MFQCLRPGFGWTGQSSKVCLLLFPVHASRVIAVPSAAAISANHFTCKNSRHLLNLIICAFFAPEDKIARMMALSPVYDWLKCLTHKLHNCIDSWCGGGGGVGSFPVSCASLLRSLSRAKSWCMMTSTQQYSCLSIVCLLFMVYLTIKFQMHKGLRLKKICHAI